MKYLIIVESPAKCNKILSFLGDNYQCEATYGHLRHVNSLNSIDNHYNITFENIKEKERQIEKIRKKIKQCDEVILATDDDREGEGIAWHVMDMFNLPLETKRIKFNSITKESILKAINNPQTVDMDMVSSQQTRQILDLLVGFKLSPILWKEISRSNNLSAGRCQTPALHILYENHMKSKDLEHELSYQTVGYFSNKNIQFILNKSLTDEKEILQLLNICNKLTSFPLTHDMKSGVERKSPHPFITSTLQQSCNNVLNMSPKDCMSVCQKLYEAGHITYMRTDSFFLADTFKEECNTYITKTYGDKYYNHSFTCKKNDNSQEAHEAIRPTCIHAVPELSGKEKKVYELIRKQTLKSLMMNGIVDVYKFKIYVDETYHFVYTIDNVVFLGWMILDDNNKRENESIYLQYLLHVNKITSNKIESVPTFNNTSIHYSEARLIKELETKHIGRPSTFASIIEKIKERKYAIKGNVTGEKIKCCSYELHERTITKKKTEKVIGNEKNKLIIQPLGILVIEMLMKHFSELFQYGFTESMELQLDEIACNKNDKETTCDVLTKSINRLTEKYNSIETQKMMIDDKHEFIISKNGPVIKMISDDGKYVFKKIIDNFDIEKIKNHEYSIDELIDASSNERTLGQYRENNVILKRGKFGIYVEYDNRKISIKNEEKNFADIILSDVIDLLDGQPSGTVRQITNEMSIRCGKYGHYIYYKTNKMKKPKFINLQKFKDDHITCDKQYIIDFVTTSL